MSDTPKSPERKPQDMVEKPPQKQAKQQKQQQQQQQQKQKQQQQQDGENKKEQRPPKLNIDEGHSQKEKKEGQQKEKKEGQQQKKQQNEDPKAKENKKEKKEDTKADKNQKANAEKEASKSAGQVPKKKVTKVLDSDVHPAIRRLGMLYQNHSIRGGNARCIAMLQAFKEMIQDYTTPENKSIARDFIPSLNKPIQYLVNKRKLSVSMGNAISCLKHHIQSITDNTPEIADDAFKKEIFQYIDMYLIYERIIFADRHITQHGASKIVNGDSILVYGRSSAVEMILKEAKKQGKSFSVFVVDSRPHLEGKGLMERLVSEQIPCTYCLINSLSNIISGVSKVFIGAAAVLTNGSVYNRIGTGLVCLMASQFHKPVLCCCETYKFTDKSWLNSLSNNDWADEQQLMISPDNNNSYEDNNIIEYDKNENLSIINMQYDLTPPEHISMLITEVGMIPPTSVPVVIREYHLTISE